MKVDLIDWIFRFTLGLVIIALGVVSIIDSQCLTTQCRYTKLKQSVTTLYINGGLCSGTYIENNYILTAAHCLSDINDVKAQVVTSDGVFVGEVVGLVPTLDTALVYTPTNKGTPVELGDTRFIEAGDSVISVTTPVGLIDTLGTGLISHAPRYNYNNHRLELQYVANQFFGSSGGGVFDSQNRLIGVVSYFLAFPDFMFAIAIDQLKPHITSLITEHQLYLIGAKETK